MTKFVKKVKDAIEIAWQYGLLLGTKFIEALGVLMLIYELLSLINSVDDFLTTKSLKIWMFGAIIVISAFYAWCYLFKKRKTMTIDINKRTRMIIEKGDIFKANGMKVIPVNEYFDTHLGDGIIKETTIHGQFLEKYQGCIDELRKKIDAQLSQLTPSPSNRERTMFEDLPQTRYPLGTCVRVAVDGQYYLLVAITRFNSYEHVEPSAEEYPEVIRKMFNGIEQLNNGNAVYMPLVGSGISGYELTNMQMLNTIVQAASNANKLSITNGLYLYLYDDEQIASINLNIIKYLYDRWITLK